jgi:hypothetical protein
MCRPTDAPPYDEPLGRGSVALAVLGEMLNDAEIRARTYPGPATDDEVYTLRQARDRVAAAEAAL